ncbi:DNA polymerase III subunit chi [Fluoribacter dumoffii]|uniref:DNA polymerase III subunit chi n=1 Tax=Fluoribacter dumoffii TaxID=463 RepID=UPI002244DC39|nr:DNA polymerase III subunit chi [Fluoribacter dumoffii]MCW8386457.1 DNA polymerase III subunit chi [Fluoribacter dumoffii]MCW8419510.1 DNA polymerase III subunit chi [Fluoribacter dumoffii]MCW8455787.1 DNA polymerase III subunit chi [Fluoribacter dumoffii]MCW8460134.1 DNA polymerase III subunit chi [Fluoribacter dumoffii]MCW8483613.1 DNA polymerase III subunit chi [Fluoribacter dumoffii]
MPLIRVDFYLLASDQPDARWLVACRLLEKAYAKGHKVYVLCNNKQDAELLDELLWTFKEDSFIPHNLQGEGPEPPPPIQIGYEREPRGFNDILLNLADYIPDFYSRFKRIMQIVNNVEADKELSRAHYRDYRAKGCELHTHHLELQ